MNTELASLLLKVLVSVFIIVLIVVLTRYEKKLKDEIAAGKATELDKLIYQFVCAADQLLKSEDPTGEKRRQYVYTLLEQGGTIITDIIKAKIEANVLKMPKTEKVETAQPQ